MYHSQHPVKSKGLTTWLIIAISISGGFFALCIIGAAIMLFAGNDTPSSTSGTSKPDRSIETTEDVEDIAENSVGTPVRDGKLEFLVKAVTCNVSQVGQGFLAEVAQGQFCLVELEVSNIGGQAQTFLTDNQYAYNSDGLKYSANNYASMIENDNNGIWLSDINPGNSVSGVIVFDIPEDQCIDKLELHDSAFSGGVVVTVGCNT